MLDKKNFCIQPWIHFASYNSGEVPLCCVAKPEVGLNLNNQSPIMIWNSENFKKARISFLNGERISQCSTCWSEEDSGIVSHRQIENKLWINNLGQEFVENLIKNTKEDGSVDTNPITLDLRIGNTCNLQCVMCRPMDSSKWLNDSKKLSEILVYPTAKSDWAFKANSIDDTKMFDWFHLEHNQESLQYLAPDIKHIIFGGGEPLLIKDHEAFIKYLVDTGDCEHIVLRYHTNATVLKDKFFDLWKKFKGVELSLSIDDWAERNEYVRYPADWATIYENLKILDNSPNNIKVNILTTVHAMNVYNLPNFAMKLVDQKFKKIGVKHFGLFYVGFTHWPKYLSLTVLPKEIKKQIINHWESFDFLNQHVFWQKRIKSQLDLMNSQDNSHLFLDLLDYIEKLDSIRPIKFKDVYNDYYNILRNHYE
jgi:MoaA/NifB/PqqE/SkfB family radical SAM enzyme